MVDAVYLLSQQRIVMHSVLIKIRFARQDLASHISNESEKLVGHLTFRQMMKLLPLVYCAPKELALNHVAFERPDHTLQPTMYWHSQRIILD